MAVLRKRKRETTKSDDLISDLPTNVISCILDRMPLLHAVRTSVLSTKWRYNWSLVTRLDFDFHFYEELKSLAEGKDAKFVKYEFKYVFERIITKVLVLHIGNLEKVIIYIPGLKSDLVPDIQPWLYILSKKNIKELVLEGPHTGPYKLLPTCLFSCLNLTTLKLKNFICTPPSTFKGFRDLVSLQFVKVKFRTNIFAILVSGSPMLHNLVFKDCSGIDHFVVNALNLTTLRVQANGEFKSATFKNVPKLNEVSLGLTDIVENRGPRKDSPFGEVSP